MGDRDKKVIKNNCSNLGIVVKDGIRMRLGILSNKKLIRSDEYNAYNISQKIIEDAERLAKSKLEEVNNVIVEIKRQAYFEGFKHGFLKAINFIRQAKGHYIESIKKSKDDLVELSLRISEKIVAEEIRIEPEHVIAIVKKVIKEACIGKGMKMRVSKSDYNLIVGDRELIEEAEKVGIVIILDNEMEEGGCILEGEDGMIDARIKTRFNYIRDNFFNK